MMKAAVVFGVFWALLIPGLEADELNGRPDVFTYVSGEPLRSLEPASCDTDVRRRALLNIYEPLIFFDGSSTGGFAPVLAVYTPSLINGGVSQDGKTYIFKIRKGVRFHEGGELTPEDVSYSLKRAMIADPANGAQKWVLKALTGEPSTRDPNENIVPGVFQKIDNSIEIVGDAVIFHLPKSFAPFLSLLSRASSVILKKEWAVAHGCWDGNIETAPMYNRLSPDDSPLKRIANGTGAFRLKSWDAPDQFVFERFGGYHGTPPFLKTAIVKHVKEWDKRKRMLQYGSADRIHIDLPYLPQIERIQGIAIYKTPQLAVTCALFCRNVQIVDNPRIGSGKLDGHGVSPDFFWDENVRKAFLHAFDRDGFANRIYDGLVLPAASPHIEGLAFYHPPPVYDFNLKKAEAFMKKAWEGRVWKNGFKMTVTYNAGNIMRETAAFMIAENIMSLNPRFEIKVRRADWREFMDGYRNRLYPLYISGWKADFPDPYNFVHAFMHSEGAFGKYSGYQNEEIDGLIEQSLSVMESEDRGRIFKRLQTLWYEEAQGIPLYQNIDVRAYRKNVRGIVPNAVFGQEWEYLKTIRKE